MCKDVDDFEDMLQARLLGYDSEYSFAVEITTGGSESRYRFVRTDPSTKLIHIKLWTKLHFSAASTPEHPNLGIYDWVEYADLLKCFIEPGGSHGIPDEAFCETDLRIPRDQDPWWIALDARGHSHGPPPAYDVRYPRFRGPGPRVPALPRKPNHLP
jgi:hypothetical protein